MLNDEKIESAKKIAAVLKEFSFESVQLKVLDFLLHDKSIKENETLEIQDPVVTNKKKTRKSTSSKKIKKVDDTTKKTETKTKNGRPGPGQMIDILIADGYFDSKRTLNNIIEHCKSKKAYIYASNDFSTTLARALRSNKLIREQNNEGQYEYLKKK